MYSKFKDVTRKYLITKGISHPRFYGDVIKKCIKLRKDPDKLERILNALRKTGYRQDLLRQSIKMALSSDDLTILPSNWSFTDTADFYRNT